MSGFLPGLVLGIIVGAATAFVALEVMDSPKVKLEPNTGAVTGERIERDAGRAAERVGNIADDAAESLEDAGEELTDAAKDAAEKAAEEAKKLIPPAPEDDG